jgi:thymidylate synthase ThyX
MTISAKIIKDSVSRYLSSGSYREGVRLTTFELTYPRFVHSELMTHRVFSRNASSSRAKPIMTMIREVLKDPAMPVYWGANQAGMQAKKELTGVRKWLAKKLWRAARYPAVGAAYLAHKIGLHKQIANRLIEPWAHITVVITATEYRNWFALRLHPDAQPEIRELADQMYLKMVHSTPQWLQPGQWHLPYVTNLEAQRIGLDNAIKASVARCARTSYLTFDRKEPELGQDLALYEKLVGSTPLHASPAEHQAMPDYPTVDVSVDGWQWGKPWITWAAPEMHGNLRGFIQYRKTLADEYVAG